MAQHPKKKKRGKVVLDTSLQIKKIFSKKIRDSCAKKLVHEYDLFSLYFILYEFKTSFIRCLVEFYKLVELTEMPDEAIYIWSNRFGTRDVKYHVLLQSLLAQLNEQIETKDSKKYLAQIEAAIHFCLVNFHTDVGMLGSFQHDPLVNVPIRGRDDYKNFLEVISKHKMIPLSQFWMDENASLSKFIVNKNDFTGSASAEKMIEALEKISGDISKADMITINKKVGDAVIAVDVLPKHVVASVDELFKVLSPILGKKFLYVKELDGSHTLL